MSNRTAPWSQLPEETGEAHSAFRFFFLTSSREIDRAWHKFSFPRSSGPSPDDPNYHAPAQWHAWKIEHRWEERASAADREERQQEFEAAETARGNAISWSAERQEDFRDRLALYKNLRKGLLELSQTGILRDRVVKTVTKTEKGWETVIETVRAVEQLKYMERNGPMLFPADNSKPTLPGGGSLFIDLDTIAELSPDPLPVRDRARPKSIWRMDPETRVWEYTEN
ncbi:MAG: hypothetical protein JWO80_746 [Bryobacterales bacterium]|nr:hypothetical protein [Bryobacterales bacterium]